MESWALGERDRMRAAGCNKRRVLVSTCYFAGLWGNDKGDVLLLHCDVACWPGMRG